jgi:sec-independent protein translocase protein TatC
MAELELRDIPPGGALGTPALTPAPVAEPEGAVMSLIDHLSELRRRLFISALAMVAGSVVGYIFGGNVLTLLAAPLGQPLQIITVGGGFFIQLKLAFIIGFTIAIPVLLFQLWRFISPGLTAHERAVARPWIPLAGVFFAVGLVVAYFVLPFAIAFLKGFTVPGVTANAWTLESYFGFVTLLFLAFGVVMEFPMVLVLLVRLHVVSLDLLRRNRRYAILAIVIFAVIITPGGDPVSPTIMSITMYILFEITIQLLARSDRQAAKRAADDARRAGGG